VSSRPLRSPTILAVALLLEFCAIVALHILASAYLVLSVFRAFKGRYGHGRKGVPVLFVHGYAHNPAVFWFLMTRLRRAGLTGLHVVTLTPPWGSIPHFAKQVSAAVDRVLCECKHHELDIVAHSIGGVAAAYYIKFLGGNEKTRKFVSLAAPLRGTYVSYLGIGACTWETRFGCEFMKHANFGPGDFSSIELHTMRGGLDFYILPHSSASLAEPVVRHEFPNLGHAGLLVSKAVALKIAEVLAA
jgi:triacylglycerol esterase/lipase EstA (alpha/beta hydrolase family)